MIELEVNDAYTNMAIDEAILMARVAGNVPNTLRLYKWKPSAVSLGYTRDVFNDVYVDACKDNKVDLVRRITGGGTVYHDSDGEITYSVVVDEKSLGFIDVSTSYEILYSGLIEAIKILGLEGDFSSGDPRQCPNIMVEDRKISGSSQARRKGVLPQHGTLLVRVDLQKMFTLLRVPWSNKLEDVLKVAQKKVTSIERELGSVVSIDEAYEALIEGFQRGLEVTITPGELTRYEKEFAKKVREETYVTKDWTFKEIKKRNVKKD